MINVTVKLKDGERIKAALRQFPAVSIKEIRTALQKSVLTVQRDAMRNAPVNKQSGGGNLRQSIRTAVEAARGRVYAVAKYALYVHEGTRPHRIIARQKSVLANRRTGQFFGRVVNHPGTIGRPFLKNAVQENRATILGFFKEAMSNIVNMVK